MVPLLCIAMLLCDSITYNNRTVGLLMVVLEKLGLFIAAAIYCPQQLCSNSFDFLRGIMINLVIFSRNTNRFILRH